MSNDLSGLREEYTRGRLCRENLPKNPLQLFRQWLDAAQAAELPEPNAFTLATTDAGGQPFTRTVLLKQLDARGPVFFTNLESRKAQHIAGNARVSLHFVWLPLERQVSINGLAARISSAESLRYFASRPLGSRLGAWTSPQSRVIASRSLLEAKYAEMKAKFASGEVPLPSFWGGFRTTPHSWEFWQGGQNRLHDRFLYTPAEGDDAAGDDPVWTIERLAP